MEHQGYLMGAVIICGRKIRRWGRALASEWIELATREHIRNPRGGHAYGFCWFPGRMHMGDREVDYVASFGYGGQTLYLIPDLDVILIFTCELSERGGAFLSTPIQRTLSAIAGS